MDIRRMDRALAVTGQVRAEDIATIALAGFRRTGMRSATMWALSQADSRPLPELLERAAAAGYDLKGVVRRIAAGGRTQLNLFA